MRANVTASSRSGKSRRPDLRVLLVRMVRSPEDHTVIEELAGDSVLAAASIGRVLAGLVPDPVSFAARFHCPPDEFAREIGAAYRTVRGMSQREPRRYGRLRGTLGFIWFTMTALSAAAGRGNQPISPAVLTALQDLLDDSDVRELFHELYRPAGRPDPGGDPVAVKNAELARAYWKGLDLASLQVHRIGTTSFILTCRVRALGGERLALKCLLYPYTEIPVIADATNRYALDYPSGAVPSTVLVHSSTDKWILMVFAAGQTLQEFLESERQTSPHADTVPVRADLLASVGPQLLEVLSSLHHGGFQHRDLTPSNIIVVAKPDITKPDGTLERGAIERLLLIDLGRNYLYTRQAGIAESRESLFVAPEVKEDKPTASSDLYSLGMILAELADPGGALEGFVPDSLYRYTPYMARFIEDLIDADPGNRLLIFGPAAGQDVYDNLRSAFTDELKLLAADRQVSSAKSAWAQALIELLLPSSRQVGHRFRLWRQTHSAHAVIDQHSGYLLTWSIVSTAAWYAIFAVALLWGLRDVGIDAWSTPVTIIQKLTGSGSALPIIDKLRAANYQFQDWRVTLPAPVLAFSIGLAGTKYYQNILGGLTARDMTGRRAFWTEVFMRYTSFAVLTPALIGNLVQPSWWAWLAGLGFIPPAITSYLCYSQARRSLDRAKTLSTVRTSADPVLQAYGQWWSSMAVLVIALLGLAVGLQAHVVHDVWVYVLSIAALNIVILYAVKCIYFAASVRGSLARAFIAGERYDAKRRSGS
jgi:serine/threonine protein kinase